MEWASKKKVLKLTETQEERKNCSNGQLVDLKNKSGLHCEVKQE